MEVAGSRVEMEVCSVEHEEEMTLEQFLEVHWCYQNSEAQPSTLWIGLGWMELKLLEKSKNMTFTMLPCFSRCENKEDDGILHSSVWLICKLQRVQEIS